MSQPKAKKPTRRKAAPKELLTAQDKKRIAKVPPKHRASATESVKLDKLRTEVADMVAPTVGYTPEQELRFWGKRTQIRVDDDDQPVVLACVNEHRETCLRVSVGRKWTHYIAMQGTGLHVSRDLNGIFCTGWKVMVEFTPQQMAVKYLNSMAATYYISEQARTLLEEISNTGAATLILDKEHDIMATTKKAAPAAKKAAPAAKGSSKAKATKAATTAKKPVKSSPAKAAASPAKSGSIAAKEGSLAALLKAKKSGYTVEELKGKLGICRKSVLKLLASAKAKKDGETGNYVAA